MERKVCAKMKTHRSSKKRHEAAGAGKYLRAKTAKRFLAILLILVMMLSEASAHVILAQVAEEPSPSENVLVTTAPSETDPEVLVSSDPTDPIDSADSTVEETPPSETDSTSEELSSSEATYSSETDLEVFTPSDPTDSTLEEPSSSETVDPSDPAAEEATSTTNEEAPAFFTLTFVDLEGYEIDRLEVAADMVPPSGVVPTAPESPDSGETFAYWYEVVLDEATGAYNGDPEVEFDLSLPVTSDAILMPYYEAVMDESILQDMLMVTALFDPLVSTRSIVNPATATHTYNFVVDGTTVSTQIVRTGRPLNQKANRS